MTVADVCLWACQPMYTPMYTTQSRNSKVGIVLVTPALLRRFPTEGIADKEPSALLARERLVLGTMGLL
jgi:hypothetical protein